MHRLLYQLNDMSVTPVYETPHAAPVRSGVELRDIYSFAMKVYPLQKIYPSPPHGTADNHFSGESVTDMAGELGMGLTLTCRRDRFPPGTKDYFHSDKVAVDQRTKVMRFGNPIFARKQVKGTKNNYTKTFASFQSTGATNIAGVNNLPSLQLCGVTKSRGQGLEKRQWAIEWNEARGTYLATYWAVDSLDHMIKNCAIRFISWKYWHAPYNHGHSIAITAAYDIYNYCCDGLADPSWALPKNDRMSFREFRMLLSEQMLKYHPKNGLLPGDENFRAYTRLSRKQKDAAAKRKKAEQVKYDDEGVTVRNFNKAKRHKSQRLCGNLEEYLRHSESVRRFTNANVCEVCGQNTRWKCTTCDKWICVMKGAKFAGCPCLIRFHSDTFFGLAKSDAEMNGLDNWRPANANKVKKHTSYNMIGHIIGAEEEEELEGIGAVQHSGV